MAKRFQKIYLEISNVCNLSCSFCPGTKRPPKVMDEVTFSALLPKLRPWTDYLYFHLMGEPLCHPLLETLLRLAGDAGFKVILTTNGTLLQKHQSMLLQSPGLYKVNISLHAFEANDLQVPFASYLEGCIACGPAADRNHSTVRSWTPWSAGFPSPGCRSAGASALDSGSIWGMAIVSTGRICRRRKGQMRCSARACGISWACFAMVRWCLAVWITKVIFPWATCWSLLWRPSWTAPEQRLFTRDSPAVRLQRSCVANVGMRCVSSVGK